MIRRAGSLRTQRFHRRFVMSRRLGGARERCVATGPAPASSASRAARRPRRETGPAPRGRTVRSAHPGSVRRPGSYVRARPPTVDEGFARRAAYCVPGREAPPRSRSAAGRARPNLLASRAVPAFHVAPGFSEVSRRRPSRRLAGQGFGRSRSGQDATESDRAGRAGVFPSTGGGKWRSSPSSSNLAKRHAKRWRRSRGGP